MGKETKYEGYTAEDFVQDDEFRRWVLNPDEILSVYWSDFETNFPEKRTAVDLARQIVKALVFEETACNEEEYKSSLTFLKEHLFRKTKQKKLSLWWNRVAAILLLPLLAAGTYFYLNVRPDQSLQMVQYNVPPGQKSNVTLSDGTRIWLNSGSTLSYAANSEPVEKVYLTGEAFFDVTKKKKKPFLVETKDYTVKVYGTKFNVLAYDDIKSSETILKDGSITILLRNTEEVPMKPGQRFLLNEKREYSLSSVNPDLYLNWKDNILKINNERLQDLIIRMERWYGVKIQVEDFSRVKYLRYTLTIKTESLREMLELMKCVTPFSYEINGENVILKYN